MRCTIDSPRPKPPMAGRSVADPRWNSSKIISPVGFADAGAGVPHLDAHVRPAPARQQADAALLGVLHGVDHQVLQDAAQHQRVGDDRRDRCGARSATGPWRAPAARCRARWRRSGRRARTGRSAGVTTPASSLEMSRMDLSSSSIVVKRVLDALGDAALVLAAVRLGERAGRQARGMQRLQQIVADGGEEARLEAIGALGGIARSGQLVVGALQPRRARWSPPRCAGAPAPRG